MVPGDGRVGQEQDQMMVSFAVSVFAAQANRDVPLVRKINDRASEITKWFA